MWLNCNQMKKYYFISASLIRNLPLIVTKIAIVFIFSCIMVCGLGGILDMKFSVTKGSEISTHLKTPVLVTIAIQLTSCPLSGLILLQCTWVNSVKHSLAPMGCLIIFENY